MGLQYIIGRSGSGKSYECQRQILQAVNKDTGQSIIYIVPEQYTLQAEKDLLAVTERKSFMNAQVLSFKRLAHIVFGETGYESKKMLNKTARIMLIRKALFDVNDRLKFYTRSADKQGFVDNLSDMLSEFFKNGYNPQELLAQVNELYDRHALQMKMYDLAVIYDCYAAYIKEKYISSDEELDILARKIPLSKQCSQAEIFIDGFDGFSGQEYKVIRELTKVCNNIHISLCCDTNGFDVKPTETDPFFETKSTVQKINRICAAFEIEKIPPVLLEGNKRCKHELLHLENSFFAIPAKKYHYEVKNIHVYRGNDKPEEIQIAAMEINKLVREKNYRYKDIAVVTNALPEYEKMLKEIFDDYDIPYFYDAKKSIMSHPIIEIVRSTLEVITRNWTYESVFSFLKTGLVPQPREEIDILENYVLAYGIKGGKWKAEQWDFGFSDNYEMFIKEDINYFKDVVCSMFETIFENVKRGRKYTVEYITKEIYNHMLRLEINKTLEERSTDENVKSGKLSAYSANENLRIWNILIEIFEKMTEILGEQKVTPEQYLKIFEAGVRVNEIAQIPAMLDQVIIGDIDRTRLPDIKALIMIGVNDGIIPSGKSESGLITDSEKLLLEIISVKLSPTVKEQAFMEQFLIYKCMTKPSEYLYISYSAGDSQGNAMRPSSIINKLKKQFDISEILMSDYDEMELISKIAPTTRYLIKNIRLYADGININPIWKDVYSTLAKNNNNGKALSTLVDSVYMNDSEYITAPSINKLYGNEIVSSVSKLEKFVACPFSYFVQYGLKASERKMYKLQTPDLGILFHNVIDVFSKTLSEEKKDWREMTRSQTEAYVENIVDLIAPKISSEILLSTSRNKYLIHRLKRIAKRAVWTLTQHIKAGSFKPLGFEIGFGYKETLPPIVIELSNGERLILTGRIDRVDVLTKDGASYAKIIDYKSGNRTFSLKDIFYGIQLQLMLYLDALLKKGQLLTDNKLLPGGLFYFYIDDPMISEVGRLSDEDIERLLLRQLRLNGLVLNDVDIIKSMDEEIKGYSNIIPVQLKTDNTVSASSSVAELSDFEELCAHVSEKVKEIGEEIVNGNIKVFPYKDNKSTACTYCAYSSICRFEPKYSRESYNVLEPLKKEEVMNRIKAKKTDVIES